MHFAAFLFQGGFQERVVGNDPFWIDTTKLRNYTVNTYNETLAEYVYAGLPTCVLRFREALAATT